MNVKLDRYRPWFYAAAIYNLIWGGVNILFPQFLFNLIGMQLPNYLPLWQVVGMLVMVYAPIYYWAGRSPDRFRHFILIGLLVKIFGPIGFLWSAINNQLPITFGLTIIFNDLIWWPSFILFVRDAARLYGGFGAMLRGD